MGWSQEQNLQVRLDRRPSGELTADDFVVHAAPLPTVRRGEVLIRNIYLSLDPAQRLWVRERDTYMPGVKLGDVMRGFTLGEVVVSNNVAFPQGSIVSGVLGWEEYSVSDCSGSDFLSIVDLHPDMPLPALFALFAHIGLTSYFGVIDILEAGPKHTLLVSAAAGAVGSIAVQIGKIRGCRVVAIAGSDAKCRWLREELGADETINYKTESLPEALRRTCSGGVDRYFDSVGGKMLDDVLDALAMNARIAMVGAISEYVKDDEPFGPPNIYSLLYKRARIEGFVVFDYAADPEIWRQAHRDITEWYLAGRLNYRVDIVDGLERAAESVARLFDGSNNGKLLVQICPEPGRGGGARSGCAGT